MFANIIVDITHEKLDKIFQYRVPSHMEGELSIGMEVLVPFGKLRWNYDSGTQNRTSDKTERAGKG